MQLPRARQSLIHLFQAWLDFRAWQTQWSSGLRHASTRVYLENCRQETCQIVYTWVITNVDNENGVNSETTAVLSAYGMLYPHATNSKIGSKHKLPLQIAQLFCVNCWRCKACNTPTAFAVGWDRSTFHNYTSRLTGPGAPTFRTSGSWFPADISTSKQPLRKQYYQKLLMAAKKRKRLEQVEMESSRKVHCNFLSFPVSLLSIHQTLFYPLMFLLLRQT